MMLRKHTDQAYEGELALLRDRILLMGARVEGLMAQSIRALVERSASLARETMERDVQVNALEIEIDELCLKILARRQPVASDLRFIAAALKLVTDLERIADEGVNICEHALALSSAAPLMPYDELVSMAELAQALVHEALDAFVEGNVERAVTMLARDEQLDARHAQLVETLLTLMTRDAGNIVRATRIKAVAKSLERIGDHATNLAEMVVFMIEGSDIRHRRASA